MAIFYKLDYNFSLNNLRKSRDSKFAKFCTNKDIAIRTSDMPRKVFTYNFTKIDWDDVKLQGFL